MAITFDLLDRFQENKVLQTAQTMNNILKSNTKWYLCPHGNRDHFTILRNHFTKKSEIVGETFLQLWKSDFLDFFSNNRK